MTEAQKKQIREMRIDGMAYSKIAVKICISENTVKSFCRRNLMLNVDKATENSALCVTCGMRLTQTVGKRTKRFCSDACRLSWWNKNRDKVQHKNTHIVLCANCGKEVITYGKREQKYCSHECYIAARFRKGIE